MIFIYIYYIINNIFRGETAGAGGPTEINVPVALHYPKGYLLDLTGATTSSRCQRIKIDPAEPYSRRRGTGAHPSQSGQLRL